MKKFNKVKPEKHQYEEKEVKTSLYVMDEYEKCSIQDLIDHIPKKISFLNTFIEIIKSREYYEDDTHYAVNFYYYEKVPANLDQYKKDLDKYNEAYAEYYEANAPELNRIKEEKIQN